MDQWPGSNLFLQRGKQGRRTSCANQPIFHLEERRDSLYYQIVSALRIPEELAEQASQIPGLNERVERFIRFEITQFEQRQKRFQSATLSLVAEAQAGAARRKRDGFDQEEVMESFLQRLEDLKTSNNE